MLKKINKSILFLSCIFLIGLFLRFYQLGSIPAGFHADEAAYGYNAYSLLQTGKDEYGKFMPIALKSFGEYKPALYTYLTIPFIAIFDLTSFAVRIPAALFGSLTILLFYFFVKKLVTNKEVALIASFLLAISPWHISLSRTVSEVVVSLFFILLMLFGILHVIKGKIKWSPVVWGSGALAIGSYTASTFFVVLLTLIFFVGALFDKGDRKKVVIFFVVTLSLLIIIGALINKVGSANRFQQINIFQHPETKLVLEEQIREDQHSHPLITRLFHNKVVNYSKTIVQNYGEYFTLDYLVLNGGSPLRLSVPNSGLFYGWQMIFLLAGIYVVIKYRNNYGLLLLGWWFLLLLPAAVTFHEIPNLYRSLVVLPPLLILIAVGLHAAITLHRINNKFLFHSVLGVFMVIAVWEFTYYHHQYYSHQEVHQPWYRGYEYKELIAKLTTEYNHYDKVYITKAHSNPYIYILFYSKFDPARYQALGSPRDVGSGNGFDRYVFIATDCILSGGKTGKDKMKGEVGVLYVNKGDCKRPKNNTKLIDVIKWKDNNQAFQLLEYVPSAQIQSSSSALPK